MVKVTYMGCGPRRRDLLLLPLEDNDLHNLIYASISSLVHCIHSSHLDINVQSEPHLIQKRCLSREKLLILPWHFLQDQQAESPEDVDDPEDLGGSER